MAKSTSSYDYEEKRKQTMAENFKRMAQLNLHTLSLSFKSSLPSRRIKRRYVNPWLIIWFRLWNHPFFFIVFGFWYLIFRWGSGRWVMHLLVVRLEILWKKLLKRIIFNKGTAFTLFFFVILCIIRHRSKDYYYAIQITIYNS